MFALQPSLLRRPQRCVVAVVPDGHSFLSGTLLQFFFFFSDGGGFQEARQYHTYIIHVTQC